MKCIPICALFAVITVSSFGQSQVSKIDAGKNFYIDVHDLEPGKVSFQDVAGAHQKDLAVEGKYGVDFIKFWVDENKGKVYCLSTAKSPDSVISTHREAHGLLPSSVMKV